MTNISLYNRDPIKGTFTHSTSEPLPDEPALIIVDDDGFPCSHLDADRLVFVELEGSESGPPPETKVVLHSESHDLYVWEQTANGQSLWPRQSTGSSERTFSAPTDASVRVQVLSAGSTPPAAPPEPGSGSTTLLKVKVRKKGELPF